MTTTRKLNMFNDPGHAWLSVSVEDLMTLGIADKISPYSYTNGSRAFLEEDSDYSVFLDAVKKAGWKVTVMEKHHDKTSPIRSLPSYNMDTINKFLNMTVGSTVFLYAKSTGYYDNETKIVGTRGSKLLLTDQYGNNYQSSVNNLVKCCSLTNTTPSKEIIHQLEEEVD